MKAYDLHRALVETARELNTISNRPPNERIAEPLDMVATVLLDNLPPLTVECANCGHGHTVMHRDDINWCNECGNRDEDNLAVRA